MKAKKLRKMKISIGTPLQVTQMTMKSQKLLNPELFEWLIIETKDRSHRLQAAVANLSP